MLYFIVRLIANACAVALTVYLTPGIDLRPEASGFLDIALSAIILGLLFGLINSFVRPLALMMADAAEAPTVAARNSALQRIGDVACWLVKGRYEIPTWPHNAF